MAIPLADNASNPDITLGTSTKKIVDFLSFKIFEKIIDKALDWSSEVFLSRYILEVFDPVVPEDVRILDEFWSFFEFLKRIEVPKRHLVFF